MKDEGSSCWVILEKGEEYHEQVVREIEAEYRNAEKVEAKEFKDEKFLLLQKC